MERHQSHSLTQVCHIDNVKKHWHGKTPPTVLFCWENMQIYLHFQEFYGIINAYMIPNPDGFVIDAFIDIGVKQSR